MFNLIKKSLRNITRKDREANLSRLSESKKSGKISGWIEDEKTDAFISFYYNDEGKKEYNYVRNQSMNEQMKELTKNKMIKEIEEEESFFDFEYENSLTREHKKQRLEHIRKNNGLRYKTKEEVKSTTKKLTLQEEYERITDSFIR